METLRELEERLGIKPLDFSRLRNQNPQPEEEDTTNVKDKIEEPKNYVKDKRKESKQLIDEYKETVIFDHEPEAFLDSSQINFTSLSNKWRILKQNVINLYDAVRNTYQNTNRESIKNSCRMILIGMLHEDITKQEVNELVQEINMGI